MDTVRVDIVLKGGHVEIVETFDVYTWIGNSDEVLEQLAARRMRWA